MGDAWEMHGRCMRDAWEMHERYVGDVREIYGTLAGPLECSCARTRLCDRLSTVVLLL